MNVTEFDAYLMDRYEDQIKWYDGKAQKYKRLYNIFQAPILILAAITPVLVVVESNDRVKVITVVVSALVAIGTSMLKTFNFQETWISYRTTCETLKKEKHYYDWKIGEYGQSSNREKAFVERVESLPRENTMWLSARGRKGEKQS